MLLRTLFSQHSWSCWGSIFRERNVNIYQKPRLGSRDLKCLGNMAPFFSFLLLGRVDLSFWEESWLGLWLATIANLVNCFIALGTEIFLTLPYTVHCKMHFSSLWFSYFSTSASAGILWGGCLTSRWLSGAAGPQPTPPFSAWSNTTTVNDIFISLP